MKTLRHFPRSSIMVALAVVLSSALVQTAPLEIYVDDNATGVQDGSREHPFRTIKQGINAAVAGQTIIVLPGTYYENVKMKVTAQA